MLVDLDRLQVLKQRGAGYQGIRVLRVTTLSPRKAETGMHGNVLDPDLLGEGSELGLDRAERVLRVVDEVELVDGERRRGVIRAARRGKRGVASASTGRYARRPSSTPQSAVEAPVTILRVYCSWPGVSATMNFRRSVVK